MPKPGISRRAFARTLGLAALTAPFARVPKAFAEGSGFAKRLVIFFSPNGTVHEYWRPSGTRRDVQFAPGSILEPLSDWKDELVICSGIDFKGVSNHSDGMANMLTGGRGVMSSTDGRSVDQYIADEIGDATPFRALNLGVHTSAWGQGDQTRMNYSSGGEYVTPNDDPVSVYGNVFAGLNLSPGEVDRTLQRRRSILDNAVAELGELERRLTGTEREKLQQHITSIRTVERRLQGSPTVACSLPEPVDRIDLTDHSLFPLVGDIQTDLMVNALACDLTRVATIQWSHTVSPVRFEWIGESSNHHELSHFDHSSETSKQRYVAAERWFSEQFAALLTKLANRPEPDGEG
ncbi:MAG: DUF1552 domain-containing protein, partial [Myxococcales bacterium]|nr:DUF1552 domain-containing protein [Myxococcales bacterium]